MEVGVKVWAENTRTGKVVHVASAYLVFVAIDDQGRRVRVPEVIPETPDELRRYADALLRREHREAEAARRKQAKLESEAQENAEAPEPSREGTFNALQPGLHPRAGPMIKEQSTPMAHSPSMPSPVALPGVSKSSPSVPAKAG